MGMHVEITVGDHYLKTYWGVEKGSIRLVTKTKRYRTGMRYWVKAKILYPCNFTGRIEEIMLRENEVRIRILKHSDDVDI